MTSLSSIKPNLFFVLCSLFFVLCSLFLSKWYLHESSSVPSTEDNHAVPDSVKDKDSSVAAEVAAGIEAEGEEEEEEEEAEGDESVRGVMNQFLHHFALKHDEEAMRMGEQVVQSLPGVFNAHTRTYIEALAVMYLRNGKLQLALKCTTDLVSLLKDSIPSSSFVIVVVIVMVVTTTVLYYAGGQVSVGAGAVGFAWASVFGEWTSLGSVHLHFFFFTSSSSFFFFILLPLFLSFLIFKLHSSSTFPFSFPFSFPFFFTFSYSRGCQKLHEGS